MKRVLWTLLRALVRPGAGPRAPPTPRRGICWGFGAQVALDRGKRRLLRDRGQLLLSLCEPVKWDAGELGWGARTKCGGSERVIKSDGAARKPGKPRERAVEKA